MFDYSIEPENKDSFTKELDQFYTRFASVYNWFVKVFPFWGNWLRTVLPNIEGTRV